MCSSLYNRGHENLHASHIDSLFGKRSYRPSRGLIHWEPTDPGLSTLLEQVRPRLGVEAMIPQEELGVLKQRWLASGSFEDEQAYFEARVRLNDAQFVYLDPDGTLPEWIAVVVRQETNIVYGTQCAGVATEQRFVEGYLIPVGGSKYELDTGKIEVGPFVDVFHENGGCQWSWTGRGLPVERQAILGKLVESIPYWRTGRDGADRKYPLHVDDARIGEIAEAWIPVRTPDGPGVLLYKNCD